jgi:hypothetical protein
MPRYVKPTINTKYHIDFDWWEQQRQSLRIYLASHLCPVCKVKYADSPPHNIDWVDPQTGEVNQVDILWDVLRTCCSQQSDYITRQTPLTVAVMLTLIANDNKPLSSVELQESLDGRKPASSILRVLSGRKIYYGIRPVTMPAGRTTKSTG